MSKQARVKKINKINKSHLFIVAAAMAVVGIIAIIQANAQTNALSLGTLQTTNESISDCPTDSSCSTFEVSCPSVRRTLGGAISEQKAYGTPRGVVVFFQGGGGNSWYRGSYSDDIFSALRNNGLNVILLRWDSSWLNSNGWETGPALLGCRPATAIKWLHDTKYAPLGVTQNETGVCGFCVTGNSGGSTQIAYALSHYGLENIIDVAVPTGGPPHSAIKKGCLQYPGYGYQDDDDTGGAPRIDSSYGFRRNGPCVTVDPSYSENWDNDSVSVGGSDYNHPNTRIQFVWGDQDPLMQAHGGDYYDKLVLEGTTLVYKVITPNTPHNVASGQAGATAIKDALLYNVNSGFSSGPTEPETSPTEEQPVEEQPTTEEEPIRTRDREQRRFRDRYWR